MQNLYDQKEMVVPLISAGLGEQSRKNPSMKLSKIRTDTVCARKSTMNQSSILFQQLKRAKSEKTIGDPETEDNQPKFWRHY